MTSRWTEFRAFAFAAMVLIAFAVGCEHGDKAEDESGTADELGLPVDLLIEHADLEDEADVLVDEWGIPHIYARTDRDAFYLQGYMQARDRFGEIDLARKIADGRLGEVIAHVSLVGPLLADVVIWEVDHYFRTLFTAPDGRHIADWIEGRLDEKTIFALQAFVDGVNAYLADMVAGRAEAEPPSMYQGILSYDLASIEPMTIRDILGIMVVNLWAGSNSASEEIALGEALAKLGPEKFFDIYRAKPSDPTAILDSAAKSGEPEHSMAGLDLAAWDEIADRLRDALPAMQAARETIEAARQTFFAQGQHSNNWAVDGAHSATGNALVANDPHLSLLFPSFFYLVHVNSTHFGDGDVSFAGLAFPGAPGAQIGHNDYVAWSGTNAAIDAYDVYIETRPKKDDEHVVFENQLVPIRKFGRNYWTSSDPAEARTISLATQFVPHHGPIVPGSCQGTSCVSLAWTGMSPGNELDAFVDVLFAENLDEGLDAFSEYRRGMYSWILGDVNGDIGYVATGNLPIRENWRTQPPYLPLPGTGGSEWDGYIPDDAQARVKNPVSGYLATANNDIYGTLKDNNPTNDDYYYYYDMDIGYRAGRITRLLRSATDKGATLDDMARIQSDTTSDFGRRMLPFLFKAYNVRPDLVAPDMKRAIDQLATWDFSTPAAVADRYRPEYTDSEKAFQSVSATLFHVWLGRVIVNAFGDEFAEADVELPGDESESGPQWEARALLNLLESPEKTNHGELWWDDITTPVIESKEDILLDALGDAIAWLASEDGIGPEMAEWQWGRLHTAEFALAFEGISIPSLIAPALPESPSDGGWFTINVANPYGLVDDFHNGHAPAARMVMEMDGDRYPALAALPGGQVERPASVYMDNLHDEYMAGEYVPLLYTLDEIIPVTVKRIRFVPAGK
ncbi:MAG: penicillin acylase family protein [Deltaproteobacteria bacterium]|nr:penicillin acylase family protein [Deltaproteobacteria bacterium]